MSQIAFGGGGGGITSVNADTTAAQVIAGTAPITANTAAGTTTIASTAATGSVAGHVTTSAQTLGAGIKTIAGIISTARARSSVVTITDSASPVLDGSLGNVYYLNATQDCTMTTSNMADGHKFVIFFRATSSTRTLTLNLTYFTYGADVPTMTGTTSSNTDAIACIYFAGTVSKVFVLDIKKGYT